ncbi:hypothetical protein [Bosea sp. (in: a-proteobacteria)]
MMNPDTTNFSPAFRDVLAERRRQVEVKGWTPEHDDTHDAGELARAGACYALMTAGFSPYGGTVSQAQPRGWGRFKLGIARDMLVKAAALLIAEIERIDRRAAREGGAA